MQAFYHLGKSCNIIDLSKFYFNDSHQTYIPMSGCVLSHILTNNNLSNLEKLFYLIADSLALINYRNNKPRAISLSARSWAIKLGCSKSEVFNMQKSLEDNGHFIVIRDTNKVGKNKRNTIFPTIPDNVFNSLALEPNRFNLDESSELSSVSVAQFESKRAYLDRTKLFIKLNYQLLQFITAHEKLTSFAKIVWLDFYHACYKYHIKHKTSKIFSFNWSYKELIEKYSCSKFTLSKTLSQLEFLGFISKKRFFTKNSDEEDNLHDKSLWHITLTIPEVHQQQLLTLQDRSNLDVVKFDHCNEYFDNNTIQDNTHITNDNTSSDTLLSKKELLQTSSTIEVAVYDPYVANFSQHINKYFKLNNIDIKNIDYIDANFIISSNQKGKSKNLSEFYKNNLVKEEIVLIPRIPNSTSTRSIFTAITQVKNSENGEKELLTKKNLRSWHPLTKEQISKINSLANREFSTNFVNELLLKLASKYSDRIFTWENQVISYMTKAICHEKHDAAKVNHGTFRFVKNEEEGKEYQEQKKTEKYLREVEYSTDTSLYWQLRRKIAGMFESKLAYLLLTNSYFYTPKDEQCIKVKLASNITITSYQQESLSNSIKLVYGEHMEITYEQLKNSAINSNNQIFIRQEGEIYLEELNENSTWYKIRKELIGYYGAVIDKAWFSKLRDEEDKETNMLTLKASTNFIRDYVTQRYSKVIDEYCKIFHLQLNII